MGKTIDELFAFVVVDPADGDEGMPTIQPAPGMFSPMIAADRDRVESLLPVARQMADDMGVTIEMVCFRNRESLQVIEPVPGQKLEPDADLVEIQVPVPGPPRVEEDGRVAGYTEFGDKLVEGDDIKVMDGGVMVFSLLMDGVPTVCFQFFRGPGDDPQVFALQGEHAHDVGPLATAAYQTAAKRLGQQQN